MDKFKKKYRIPSARLQRWDYGLNGAYFITICTQSHQCFLGEIVEQQFSASELGVLAEKFWLEIPQYFPFVELGSFVVMPNHIHGILIVDKNADIPDINVETQFIAPPAAQSPPYQEKISGGFSKQKNPMLTENISRIIRWYKGRCTFEMRKIDTDFYWQTRFYDHIIRNAQSFEQIQTYIENNPLNWENDKFYV